MRYIFFGSPKFADTILKNLISAGYPPIGVVCNPDRPVGRKKIITSPPTKLTAKENSIALLQPEKISQAQSKLKELSPDFFVVAAYSQIIPASIISIAKLTTLGAHPSLLPLYRGATPIQSVLLNGDSQTGVTIYIVDEKMDHGPIISQTTTKIDQAETYTSLEGKLALLAAKSLVKIIPNIKKEVKKAKPQNHTLATFTKKIETNQAEVDMISDSPKAIYQKIQALNPEPGPFTFNLPGYEGKRIKLLKATLKDNNLKIIRIQPDGKNPLDLK